jgi:hypothetical protein
MSFAGSDLLKNKAASSLELFVPSIRPSVKSTILPPLRKFAFPELRYSSLSTQVGLILLGSTLLTVPHFLRTAARPRRRFVHLNRECRARNMYDYDNITRPPVDIWAT